MALTCWRLLSLSVTYCGRQTDLSEYRLRPWLLPVHSAPVSYLHVLRLGDAQLLLHLEDAAGGLGHLGSLQVPLGQQLLDVLLLLLQGFLERRGARYLAGVA